MTDRELLEIAAKAAGMTLGAWRENYGAFMYRDAAPGRGYWNPLTDDGDALRLAVKLDLAVIPYPIYTQPKHSVIAKVYKDSAAVYRDQRNETEHVEVYGADPLAATRRAIVRAAAAIRARGEK